MAANLPAFNCVTQMSKLQLLRVFGRVSDARRLYNYYVSFLEQYCVLFGNGHDPMVVTAYVHYCMCRHSLQYVYPAVFLQRGGARAIIFRLILSDSDTNRSFTNSATSFRFRLSIRWPDV